MKSDWSQLKYRTLYYEELIKSTLKLLGAPIEKLKFTKGTDYQLSTEYTINLYKLMSKMTLHDAIKSGAEVVKQNDNPKMASLLYPGLQALDEQFLSIDAQFGGVDQRKIFMMAEKYLPQLGYKKRIHLMNPMIPSFNNNNDNMSSSNLSSKIDLLDNPKTIKNKINKGFCEEGNTDCGIIKFIELVLFPVIKLKKEKFTIKRPDKYGGNIEYENYIDLEKDFVNKKLYPGDLKSGLSEWIANFLEPLRNKFNDNNMNEIIAKAY
jgi:tyrosyl-tRNA synthetase